MGNSTIIHASNAAVHMQGHGNGMGTDMIKKTTLPKKSKLNKTSNHKNAVHVNVYISFQITAFAILYKNLINPNLNFTYTYTHINPTNIYYLGVNHKKSKSYITG